jgi:tetratricopeptide (TPR) repeat protein
VEIELIQCEANAYLNKRDEPRALKILENARAAYPTNIEPFLLLNDFYVQKNDLTNAMKVIEEEMRVLPANPTPLIDYARVKMLNNQIAEAIPYLDKAIKLDGKNLSALFNRAVAHLQLKHYDEAEKDYREVENLQVKLTWPVAFGLHEVAYQKKQPKQALKYAKEYLKIAPPNAPESKLVQDRLQKIKTGAF